MVIRIVPLVALLTLSFIAFAQPVTWQVRAGWHTSSAQLIDKSTLKKSSSHHLNGFSASAGIRVEFDKQLLFTPRIQYSLHGYALQAEKQDPQEQFRLHYIELPVLLQYEFSNSGRGLFAQLGPSIGAAISGSHKTGSQRNPLRFAMTQYNRVNIDALAQIGYRFKNGLAVDASYTYGLTSITNGDSLPIIRMAQFGIGLSYRFSRRSN